MKTSLFPSLPPQNPWGVHGVMGVQGHGVRGWGQEAGTGVRAMRHEVRSHGAWGPWELFRGGTGHPHRVNSWTIGVFAQGIGALLETPVPFPTPPPTPTPPHPKLWALFFFSSDNI